MNNLNILQTIDLKYLIYLYYKDLINPIQLKSNYNDVRSKNKVTTAVKKNKLMLAEEYLMNVMNVWVNSIGI